MTTASAADWLYLRGAASLSPMRLQESVSIALDQAEDAGAVALRIVHPEGFSSMGNLVAALTASEIGLDAAQTSLPRRSRPGAMVADAINASTISVASGVAREWQPVLPEIPFAVQRMSVSPDPQYLERYHHAVEQGVQDALERSTIKSAGVAILDAIALAASCDLVIPIVVATRAHGAVPGDAGLSIDVLEPLHGLVALSVELMEGAERPVLVHPGELWGLWYTRAAAHRGGPSWLAGTIRTVLSATDPDIGLERRFAQRLLAASRRVHGRSVLRRALGTDEEGRDWFASLASLVSGLGSPDREEQLAWAALARDGGQPEAGLLLLASAGDGASVQLERALLHEQLGMMHARRQEFDQARALLESLRDAEGLADPWFCLCYARFLEARGDPDARRWYREATRTHQGNVFLLTAAAAAMLKEGDERGAAEAVSRAEVAGGDRRHVQDYTGHLRGELARLRLEHIEAESAFRALLDRAPEHLASLVSLGGLFLDLGCDATARYWLDQALAVEPENAPARLLSAILRCQGTGPGEAEKGELQLRELIAETPGQDEAHTALAVTFRRAGLTRDAREVLATMPRSDRGEPYRQAELAQLDLLIHDYDSASERLTTVRRAGGESVALALLGKLACLRDRQLRDDLFGDALNGAASALGRVRILNTWAECAVHLDLGERARALAIESVRIDPWNRFTRELEQRLGVEPKLTISPQALRDTLVTFIDPPQNGETEWTRLRS